MKKKTTADKPLQRRESMNAVGEDEERLAPHSVTDATTSTRFETFLVSLFLATETRQVYN